MASVRLKIGILSMQKVVNHGSFLQAYALLQIIKKLRPNAIVEFIDIRPGKLLYKKNKIQRLCYRLNTLLDDKSILAYMKRYILRKRRKKLYQKLWHIYLNISKEHNWDTFFDTIVIGSDEVFNCLQDTPWGFAKNLLGEGLSCNNIITYAASCGSTTFSKVEHKGLSDDVKNAIRNIQYFSVRDENTYQFVKKFADKNAYIHLDPVLLYDYKNNLDLNKKTIFDRYILIYSYTNRIKKEEIIAICNFAESNNLEIISVYGYQYWCKYNLLLSPFDVLLYFKKATYVITDTFHGSILSIKYNKQFVAFVRGEKEISPNLFKLRYLLGIFNLQNREILKLEDIPIILKQEINFTDMNTIISKQIERSLEYLDKYLCNA